MRKFITFLTLFGFVAATALAGPQPYNESANAKQDVQQALAEAKAAKTQVLLVLGANWCKDCLALDQALKNGRNAELMASKFKVVKIDVGNFDRNLDLVAQYGNPIKKGIPAAVLLSADNEVQYATKAGELADARRMSEDGIYAFFLNISNRAKSQ